MKKQMRYVVRSQFVRGLSSLLDVAEPAPRSYQSRSSMQALRGDMTKIGADMHRVIERERANEKAKTARKPGRAGAGRQGIARQESGRRFAVPSRRP